MLKIFNSLTRQKEIFQPIEPGKIKLYVCGMTVYDFCHLGHARVMVVFDMVVRYLQSRGFEVTYIRNITDIDDKIINRAHQQQKDFSEITQTFIQAMHEDEQALNILRPTKEPRATEYIPHMIHLIETLMKAGVAYVPERAEQKDVYFSVAKFQDYGKLSGQNLEALQAGARIEISESKYNPLDFVLWKLAKPGEPAWDSPWGRGRPGWHIECSAMALDCLGAQFDIHGGGYDLLFPHHENEIAQSESATKKTFVNTWMHVGYLQINQEKMSKSLNNFFTIREVLKQYSAEVIRYFILTSHYRSPLNYSEENLKTAEQALNRLYLTLRDVSLEKHVPESHFIQQFHEAMDDDFNTPEALAVLFECVREINRLKSEHLPQAEKLATVLKYLANSLGLLEQDPDQFLKADQDDALIESLILERNEARAAKDWQKADEIRHKLTELGIVIEDGAEKTTWRKA